MLGLPLQYVTTGGSSAVAQVLPLWLNFKTYFQTTIRWVAKTATIGNFVRLGSVGLALVICGLIAQDLMRDVVTIEPISVPKALSDNGYTPEVAGHRLRDALNSYASHSRTDLFPTDLNSNLTNLDLNLADRGELPDFVVPQLGLSLSAIVSSIRSVLHSRRANDIGRNHLSR